MIEIKVSQGAKPGHGGHPPRRQGHRGDRRSPAGPGRPGRLLADVPQGVLHPAGDDGVHRPAPGAVRGASRSGSRSASATPGEFMAIVKAMIESETYADFIVVDGGEGGTGAAPLEFSDSLGMPLLEGLMLVQNVLVGRGHPGPVQDRGQRQDGQRLGHRPVHGPGRRLVQLRPRLHVRRRLHPVPALPHQQVPGRGHDPGQQAPAGAGRARQGRAGGQLPPEHRARPGGDGRGDGPGPHLRAAAAPGVPPGQREPGADLRRDVHVLRRSGAHRGHGGRAVPAAVGPGLRPVRSDPTSQSEPEEPATDDEQDQVRRPGPPRRPRRRRGPGHLRGHRRRPEHAARGHPPRRPLPVVRRPPRGERRVRRLRPGRDQRRHRRVRRHGGPGVAAPHQRPLQRQARGRRRRGDHRAGGRGSSGARATSRRSTSRRPSTTSARTRP